MCVTRPQTRPGDCRGVCDRPPEAVAYAHENRDAEPQSSAIYGGGAAGIPIDTPEAVEMLMTMALDTLQAYPF